MTRRTGWTRFLIFLSMLACAKLGAQTTAPSASWQQAGWGGGGYYWATAFDATKDGVIYMSGDVDGVYKTEDHGQHWRLSNNGLSGYAVYSLATDPHSQTVFAGTTTGLCKSTDGGEHWALLPKTGPKDLRLTGERYKSSGNIAVDPVNGNIIYVGSPAGGIFKSSDGGQTWDEVYTPQKTEADSADTIRLQIGKVNGQSFAGFWFPLVSPASSSDASCRGLHFSFKAEGTLRPGKMMLTLSTKEGIHYRSKDLADLFGKTDWQDVLLKPDDFSLDSDFVKSHPDQAKAAPATPKWSEINRMDFACVNELQNAGTVRLKDIYFAAGSAETAAAPTTAPVLAKDFAHNKFLSTYGNSRAGAPGPGSAQCVAVAAKNPNLVAAAVAGTGILLSEDAGQTWQALATPKSAMSVAIAAGDPHIFYASFGSDGVYQSTDQGKTWAKCSDGINAAYSVVKVVISPENPDEVYAIANQGWTGFFYHSDNGGKSWNEIRQFAVDPGASPVTDHHALTMGLSKLSDISINPHNPQELFISANWNPVRSEDGGKSLQESDRGADISCIYDLRFHGGRTYACAMDEGAFVSDDDGGTWRNLWPAKYTPAISGHNWRLAIDDTATPGVDHIVATITPWADRQPNRVVVSDDGGKSYSIIKDGLPNYLPTSNTMWGTGYARALAADPHHPKVLYLGMDGDLSAGHAGGGIFKSEDWGRSWKQLEHQPGSRRGFFGLVVDPTDSNRIYWGCCGRGGGVWRSEDAGESWQRVFGNDMWIFNVMATEDGTVYCGGKNLWRSTDHGKSWKQLTHFKTSWQVVGLAADPADPKTMWISAVTWGEGSVGGVFKTSDDGATWQDISDDLPYRKPMVLRFNPATRELWAAGVGLFKLKQ
jgi:photosystem II stability/assembly factor-like uncharacterized protein